MAYVMFYAAKADQVITKDERELIKSESMPTFIRPDKPHSQISGHTTKRQLKLL